MSVDYCIRRAKKICKDSARRLSSRKETFELDKTKSSLGEEDNGWRLSPLYDVNPVPYGDELSLNVDEENNGISIDLAIQTAVRFGIHENDARNYAEDILKIVRENWEKIAADYRMTRRQIEEMRPAFSACYD